MVCLAIFGTIPDMRRYMVSLGSSFLAILIAGFPFFASGGAETSLADRTAQVIRLEASRTLPDPAGLPLPLASHWNTGGPSGEGFTADLALRLIDQGHYVLPWLQMPSPSAPRPANYVVPPAFDKLAQLRLPFTLVGTQWERLLTADPAYLGRPADQNPNVVRPDGRIDLKVSPFGPIAPWQEVGQRWATSPGLAQMQQRYPNPPRIVFLSNNEHSKLRWKEVEQDGRYLALYGAGRDDDFKRKVVGDGWIERYRALQSALRDGLTPSWRQVALCAGYNAFGPPHFARWPQWKTHSLFVPGRVDPWPLAWDGASVSYYTNNWEAITDFTVYSPQTQAMNWVFMLEEARRNRPDFWFELSVWDGYAPDKDNDKRKFYASRGQVYSPDRYAGMVQFGMWLLRPRVVREFRSHRDRLDQCLPFFTALVQAVDRVHANSILAEFWRKGALVANGGQMHPYQSEVPSEYAAVPRWYCLDTSADPLRPWRLGTQLPVFALALVNGEQPNRRWLVYAHSPLGRRSNVEVQIPSFRSVAISTTPEGVFYLIDEATGQSKVVR